MCRASAGACDLAETCTGASPTCPADQLVAATTVQPRQRRHLRPRRDLHRREPDLPRRPARRDHHRLPRQRRHPRRRRDLHGREPDGSRRPARRRHHRLCRASAGACDLVETCTGA
ncbi:MAG: hypothetical protein U0802_06050 [Candidatus Binatia bacterium]